MYFLYFLYSEKIQKFYIGQTEDITSRLQFHNSELNTIWTQRGRPWKLVGLFEFPTKKDVLCAEKFVKRQKSKTTIAKVIQDGFLFENTVLPNLI